jgi:hypothetical protein
MLAPQAGVMSNRRSETITSSSRSPPTYDQPILRRPRAVAGRLELRSARSRVVLWEPGSETVSRPTRQAALQVTEANRALTDRFTASGSPRTRLSCIQGRYVYSSGGTA